MQNIDQMFTRLHKERQDIIDCAERDARRSSFKMPILILLVSGMAGALINHWVYPISDALEKWRARPAAQSPAIYNFSPIQDELKQIDERLSRIEAVVVGRPHKLENK